MSGSRVSKSIRKAGKLPNSFQASVLVYLVTGGRGGKLTVAPKQLGQLGIMNRRGWIQWTRSEPTKLVLLDRGIAALDRVLMLPAFADLRRALLNYADLKLKQKTAEGSDQ